MKKVTYICDICKKEFEDKKSLKSDGITQRYLPEELNPDADKEMCIECYGVMRRICDDVDNIRVSKIIDFVKGVNPELVASVVAKKLKGDTPRKKKKKKAKRKDTPDFDWLKDVICSDDIKWTINK